MAKLCARGRTEIARWEKETDYPPGSVYSDGSARLISWDRETRALMSDGKILRKDDSRFLPDQYNPAPRVHTWGWKVMGRIRDGATLESLDALFLKCGFRRVS